MNPISNVEAFLSNIRQVAETTDFSGVVSVFQDDAVLLNAAFGYRDVKNRSPNTPTTLFGIASGTKVFTALGIGVLVDQGVITLDTAVGEIDRAYAGFIDPRATVRQLLTHTSGIYDYYDEEIEQDFEQFSVAIPWYDLETPSDYWPLFVSQVMKFRPGERFAYSNGGYVFLGMLIETLTGRLYRDFVSEHVLQAAAMQRSGFYAFNDLPENTANGYFADRKTTNIYQLPLRGGGDGGMYTTTDDLRTFWRSLIGGEILSEALTATYLQTQWAFNDTSGYGCGLYKRLDDSMYFIVGGDAGVGFASRHFPQQKLTINILSNITDGEEAVSDVVHGLV